MSAVRRVLLVLLLLAAGAALVLAWLSRHSFHREPRDVEVGLQGEALDNPTLLLQKWLAAEGRTVVRKGGEIHPSDLPPGGTLILVHVPQPLSPAEAATILAWVREGGFLLTDGSAAPFDDERGLAALHRALGVALVNLQTGPAAFQPKSQEGTDTFYTGERPYRIRRSAQWRLVPEDRDAWAYFLGHDGKAVLLTRAEGQGRIALTPDLSFLYGQSLADLDHAAYLARLFSLHPGPGPVVVWSLPMEASLLAWLKTHAPAPSLALLLLVAAWAWRGWPRFGPALPAPPPHRRSLREHLAASGRLLWRQGAGAHLAACTREAVHQRAQRRNPAYGALDLGARADWLARTAGGDAGAIGAALDDRPGRTDLDLAQDLLTLEQLRQRL